MQNNGRSSHSYKEKGQTGSKEVSPGRMVIILNYVPRPSVFNNYGIPYFKKNDIPFSLVLVKEKLYLNEQLAGLLTEMVENYGLVTVNGHKSLVSYLQQFKDISYLVSNLNNCYRNPRLFNKIAQSYKLVGLGLKYTPKSKKDRVARLQANPLRILQAAKTKLTKSLTGDFELQRLSRLYLSNEEIYNKYLNQISDTTKVRLAPSNEFDHIFHMADELSELSQKSTCVFLDTNLMFHPDMVRLVGDNPFDKDSYFSALKSLFQSITNNLKLDIVVALHPSAQHSDYERFLHGVKLVKGNTMKEVYQSRLVLMHGSTSSMYAAYFGKPLRTLVSNEILSSKRFREGITQWSKEFAIEPINIDTFSSIDIDSSLLRKSDEAYQGIVARYLMPKGTDTPYYKDLLESDSSNLLNH
ncbi:MAG: hypothetical protein Roseis2KO_01990 [Roseivirga sp.]